jgi:succinoglycan biosynthesis protein ExoA
VGGYDDAFSRAQDWEMNYRLRRDGGLIWFTPRLRVSYRPRGSLRALAEQYFNYGRWRAEVMRQYPDTVNLRYLAPPTALVAVTLGTVLGLVGLAVHPLLWGWLLPLGYLAAVVAGSVATSGGLPWRAAVWLPVIYPTMHGSWGSGFLGSVKRYRGRVRRS